MTALQKKSRSTSAKRVADYRRRMRESGLVPKTIWVPDTKDPAFVAEYERQARAIAADLEGEADIMAWIEAVQADIDLGPDYRPIEKK